MVQPGQVTSLKGVEAWKSQTIRLRYSLSYVKLFEVAFKALQDPSAFDPQRELVTAVQPPIEEVPTGYDVVVQRYQLLAAEIPVIRHLPTMLCYAPRQLLHFYTNLAGGATHAFKGLSSKSRSSLVRKVRNWKDFCGGEIHWGVYKTPDEMRVYHQLARQVARNTYQERLFDSGLPASDDFRREMLDLAQRDLVRGFLLFHDAKPVAYLYLPAPDGFLVYDYLGYDPEYADKSPGTVLQYLALEALYAEERFPLYYWGYGYSQTKKTFSTGQVLGADIFYFRRTLRNILAVHLHHSIDRLSASMGALMERVKLKTYVRRWLRKC
jgi:hypothetical protein